MIRIYAGLALAVIIACFAALATWHAAPNIPIGLFSPAVASPPASAHLKIMTATGGHGSGTHIGDGFILTAAHVVGDAATMTALDSNGSSYDATVLWSNRSYDLALMRIDPRAAVADVAVDCRSPPPGTRVTAYGNPADWDDLYTRGEIIGPPRKHGPWHLVLPMDMTIIPGQSGGAAIADDGRLVGVLVGVMVYGVGLTGIGYVVPASSACELLGRAA